MAEKILCIGTSYFELDRSGSNNSTVAQGTIPSLIGPRLEALLRRPVTIVNQGHSGSTQANWASGGAYMNAALTAAAGASLAIVDPGCLNDNAISAATFATQLASTISALRGAGMKVLLLYPGYCEPIDPNQGAGRSGRGPGVIDYILSCMPYIDAAVDRSNVLGPVKETFYYLLNRSSRLIDQLHPSYGAAEGYADIIVNGAMQYYYARPGVGAGRSFPRGVA